MGKIVTDPVLNCDTGFPERLMDAIANKFRSTRQFSLSSGIPASSLAQYLKGISEPTRPVLCSMAETLDVSLSWLATGQEELKAVNSPLLDEALLTEIVEYIDSEFKFEKAKNKAPLIAKIYAYIMKKRAEREASKEKDTAEIIDLIEILKSAV